jgi:hypothetical protein
MMRTLWTVIATGAVTATVTWFIAISYSNDRFGLLIQKECPHLVVASDRPDVQFIKTLDGYMPVRPLVNLKY